MTNVEQFIRSRIEAGEPFKLADIGESALLTCAHELATSKVFGDAIEALAADWLDLDDLVGVLQFVVDGLRRNPDWHTLAHAIEALAMAPPPNLRPIVLALDQRSRDGASAVVARVEAAAGIMRFALLDSQWAHLGSAALATLEDVEDQWAGPMLCRLASLAYEQFGHDSSVFLLERLAARERTAAEAAYERGVLHISFALARDSLIEVAADLRIAGDWLRRAEAAEEDRRDARVYRLLVDALIPLTAAGEAPSTELAEALREVALTRAMWDTPRAGGTWLLPPPEADLEWVPLVDDLVRVAAASCRPGALDTGAVLADVIRVYKKTRSVRTRLGGVERVIAPEIGGAFVHQQATLGEVGRWAAAEPFGLSQEGRCRLLDAAVTRAGAPPPGNPKGTSRTGPATSSKRWRPN